MTERPFYGWVVLAAAFVIITMSIGTLFTLAAFLRPIEDSMLAWVLVIPCALLLKNPDGGHSSTS